MSHGKHSGSFQSPDEKREFRAKGFLEVLKFDGGRTVGHGVFQPGWKWSTDVKPIAGTASCETEHTGYCLQGRMTVRMNDGEQFELRPGEAFHIPPGHDAWVEGDRTCEMIDVTGATDYAARR